MRRSALSPLLCLALAACCGRSSPAPSGRPDAPAAPSPSPAATPADPAAALPSHKDLGTYPHRDGPDERAIVLAASTPEAEVLALARKLHTDEPGRIIQF
ncbi:MAG: hypothetical protein EOO75_10915, partial [Myxococcales bacterium]